MPEQPKPRTRPSMSFASTLKGRVAERILMSLLERASLRVTPLGIETLLDEVKFLDHASYKSLGLPPALRSLPDLIVASPRLEWVRLVEVKFRRVFDLEVARELKGQLDRQRQHWPEYYAVLMIGTPRVEGMRFHQDFIRVVPPAGSYEHHPLEIHPGLAAAAAQLDERMRAELIWDQLPKLSALVGAHAEQDFWTSADYVTAAIRDLRNL